MKTLLSMLFLALVVSAASSQTIVYPDQRQMPARPKTFSNEVGFRYGIHAYLGHGTGPSLQAFSIDYARYNYHDLGFRTGLNFFIDEDVEKYFSIPLQFTWRSKHFRAEARSSDRGYYYNHQYYPDESYGPGNAFWDVLLSILPSAFEAHAGFTPGLMCGPFSYEPYDGDDSGWEPYLVRRRFSCTFDVGVRLIIPIWRFNLFGDFTYHCYLSDNLRKGDFRPSRSYMGLGVGLSFNF